MDFSNFFGLLRELDEIVILRLASDTEWSSYGSLSGKVIAADDIHLVLKGYEGNVSGKALYHFVDIRDIRAITVSTATKLEEKLKLT